MDFGGRDQSIGRFVLPIEPIGQTGTAAGLLNVKDLSGRSEEESMSGERMQTFEFVGRWMFLALLFFYGAGLCASQGSELVVCGVSAPGSEEGYIEFDSTREDCLARHGLIVGEPQLQTAGISPRGVASPARAEGAVSGPSSARVRTVSGHPVEILGAPALSDKEQSRAAEAAGGTLPPPFEEPVQAPSALVPEATAAPEAVARSLAAPISKLAPVNPGTHELDLEVSSSGQNHADAAAQTLSMTQSSSSNPCAESGINPTRLLMKSQRGRVMRLQETVISCQKSCGDQVILRIQKNRPNARRGNFDGTGPVPAASYELVKVRLADYTSWVRELKTRKTLKSADRFQDQLRSAQKLTTCQVQSRSWADGNIKKYTANLLSTFGGVTCQEGKSWGSTEGKVQPHLPGPLALDESSTQFQLEDSSRGELNFDLSGNSIFKCQFANKSKSAKAAFQGAFLQSFNPPNVPPEATTGAEAPPAE